MNDPPPADAVRARMQQIRCEIDQDLEEMVGSARSLFDWKHYVKTYPWVCLGTAAALGFLIVPKKRPTTIHADLATLTELARNGHLVTERAPVSNRGLVDALVATVASIAVRKAGGWLGQGAARFMAVAANAPLRPPQATDDAADRACRRD